MFITVLTVVTKKLSAYLSPSSQKCLRNCLNITYFSEQNTNRSPKGNNRKRWKTWLKNKDSKSTKKD